MTPTHDSPARYSAEDWIRQAQMAKRDKRDDLVPFCLNQAAVRAAEGEKSIAEMLETVTWT